MRPPSTNPYLPDEEGACCKKTAPLRIALAYPNTYYVAMSALGWQLIYRLFNDRPDTCCERFCLPEGNSRPLSLESNAPLERFHIIAFSVSYEDDYLNLIQMLIAGGIPLLTKERREEDPLVIMGGVCAFMNPEPLADFVDAFVLGEGEEVCGELLDAYLRSRRERENKEDLLTRLSRIPGVYVPRFYRDSYGPDGALAAFEPQGEAPYPLRIRTVTDLDKTEGRSRLFTAHTEFKNTCLIELSRGCTRGCHFCLLGSLYRPCRARSLEQVRRIAEQAMEEGRKIGLLGAAASDYPHMEELCAYLAQRDTARLSISSIRAESMSDTLLQALLKSGQRSLTLAPEAGSERLRRFLNKRVGDEIFLQGAERALRAGFSSLKLYFMIGLPTESDEDLYALADLCRRCKAILLRYARGRGRIGRLTVSLSCFVPKPHTPFQWLPMEREKELRAKLRMVKKLLGREANLRLLSESPRLAFAQGLLARGDRRLGKLLLAAALNGGNWKKALREGGRDAHFYLYRHRDIDELLPWRHLQSDETKERLAAAYRRLEPELR